MGTIYHTKGGPRQAKIAGRIPFYLSKALGRVGGWELWEILYEKDYPYPLEIYKNGTY